MKIYMAIVIFLFIGAFFIIAENNLNVSKAQDLGKFAPLYASWIGHNLQNSWQTVGYAVNLEWLPKASDYDVSKEDKVKNFSNSPVDNSSTDFYG